MHHYVDAGQAPHSISEENLAMTTATGTPDVPAPFGARPDAWQDDVPQPYRVLFGALRHVEGLDVDRVSVQPTAIQLSDGRVDDGSLYEPPLIYLSDDGLSTVEARDLAAALIEAADEVERWAANEHHPGIGRFQRRPRWTTLNELRAFRVIWGRQRKIDGEASWSVERDAIRRRLNR
jgi:hypothetical protein